MNVDLKDFDVNEVLKRIEEWLIRMDVKAQRIPGKQGFVSGWDLGGQEYNIALLVSPQWINIKACALEKDQIPDSIEPHLYREILKANFKHNSITFSIDDTECIWCESDVPNEGNYHAFMAGFMSIPAGLLEFQRILKRVTGERKTRGSSSIFYT